MDRVCTNMKIENDHGRTVKEYDIIAENGSEVVAVEVKSFLTVKDTNDFLERGLRRFKEYSPRYKNYKLYGAMAYLKSKDKAADDAEKKGLFVIKAVGDSANMKNSKHFKPAVF